MGLLQSSFAWIPLSVILYGLYRLLRSGHREKHLPPGPPTLPVIGNAHQIPRTRIYKKFKEWSDEYGSVFSLKVGSDTIIVLNDRKAVHDLFDKRSAIFSDRPFDYTFTVGMGDENFATMHVGARWRAERKIASQNLSPKALDERIAPIQEAEMCVLLHNLLEAPQDFEKHVKRTTASIISIVLYGHRGPTADNFWASAVYEVMERVSEILEPGAHPPVESFPFLHYVPDRLLGGWSGWKERVKDCYETGCRLWGEARDRVAERRQRGDYRPSIVDRLLGGEMKLDVELDYNAFNNFIGTIANGGADTSASAVLTNIFLLVAHPQYQRKAQAEIDRVVGVNRLPSWSDFDKLPYINCIMKEGLRYAPILPAGLPHRCEQDNWYEGMLIPKNASVFAPAWALNHSIAEDPDTYNPDRYLKHPRLAMDYAGSPDYMNRDHYAYGAGRRICVGIHLAERSIWRIMAKLLWTFDIEPAIDTGTGKPVQYDVVDFLSEGTVQYPNPYKVQFKPRSEKRVETLRSELKNAAEFLNDWE